MRRNLTLRIAVIAATLALTTTHAAVAQLDVDDPLYVPVPGVHTAVVMNATTDATVNDAIDRAARQAHQDIDGVISGNKKKNGYFVEVMPDSRSVVERARDFADDRDDPSNLIIMSGGDSQLTFGLLSRYPGTTFIDIGQPAPCLDEAGRPDRTGACLGEDELLPFNYSVVPFEVQDPAYLAGLLAASASRNDRLGIISGMADCDECNRYIQGFIRGAQSIEPDIDIEVAYLADDGEEAYAFGDPTAARTFADAFIDVYEPDVLLPIASGASLAMIEAADAAGILAVGTDVDVAGLHQELGETVLTSITKDVDTAVRHSIFESTTGDLPRVRPMTLADGYVDLTDEWKDRSGLPTDVVDRYNDARDALLSGAIDACPSDCGKPYGPGGSIDVGDPADVTPTAEPAGGGTGD